jgi:hypothetical protein
MQNNLGVNTHEFTQRLRSLEKEKTETLLDEISAVQRKNAEALGLADEMILRQETFIELAQELMQPEGTLDPVEKRLLESDLTLLYVLFVDVDETGTMEVPLQTLYQKKCARGETTLSYEDVLPEMVEELINTCRDRSEELVYTERDTAVTLGLEVESFPGMDTPDLDHLISPDTGKHPEYAEDVLEKAGVIKTSRETYGAHEIVTSPASSHKTQVRQLMHLKRSFASRTGNDATLGIHENLAGIELSHAHTEIMDIMAIGTAGGLIKSIYTRSPIDTQRAPEILAQGKSFGREVMIKPSVIAGETYYIPRHKARDLEDVEEQTKAVSYPSADTPPKHIVERRTNLVFGGDEFSRFAKDLTFTYTGARGGEAIQSSVEDRSNTKEALVTVWRDMITEWKALLEQAGIEQPKYSDSIIGPIANWEAFKEGWKRSTKPQNTGAPTATAQEWANRYSDAENNQKAFLQGLETAEGTGYDIFLDTLELRAQADPEFQKKANDMIITYIKNVRRVIKTPSQG